MKTTTKMNQKFIMNSNKSQNTYCIQKVTIALQQKYNSLNTHNI